MENISDSTFTEDDHSGVIRVHASQLVYHIILVLFGVPGNCLILRVYWTKTIKTSTHVLIMGLAWADLAVCLMQSLGISERILYLVGSTVPQWLFILPSLQHIALGVSSVLTGVIAVDRYDCVCRPQHRFFTHRRAKIAAWASLLLSVLANIPGFFAASSNFSNPLELTMLFALQFAKFVFVLVMIALCYGKVYLTIRKHARVGIRQTVQEVRPESEWSTRFPLSLRENSQQTAITSCDSPSISKHTLQASLPVASQSKAELQPDPGPSETSPPVQEPNESVANRGLSKKGNSAVLQRKTTRMLFITSLVYLLTWMPYWVYAPVTLSLFNGAMVNPAAYEVLMEISYIVYVNNAVNPLIYGLANRRFRKDCKEVIRKLRLCP